MNTNKIIQLKVGLIQTNCWIYLINKTGKTYPQNENGINAAIIDPGDEAQKIIACLEKNNIYPKYILLTHGHFDHIAAIPDLMNHYKNIPEIAIHRLDSKYLGTSSYNAHCQSMKMAFGDLSYLDSMWKDMPAANLLLEEGSNVGPFTVLHVPGHSQGSVVFWDKEEKIMFSGDTLFSGDHGRTDLPGGDEDEIYKSLKRLLVMDADIQVFPGHEQTTTIGKERYLLN